MTPSFLGVIATFYDAADVKKLSLVLGVRKFGSTHHTSANVLSEMRCVLKEYAPIHGKIWKHVTDSGSNMVCAFRNAFDDDLSEEEAEVEQAEEIGRAHV